MILTAFPIVAAFLLDSGSGLLKGIDDIGVGSFFASMGLGTGGTVAGRGAGGVGSSRLFHMLIFGGPPDMGYNDFETLFQSIGVFLQKAIGIRKSVQGK
jgi:hypothetical protein